MVKFHRSFFLLRGNTPGDLINTPGDLVTRSFFLWRGNTPVYRVSVICVLLLLISCVCVLCCFVLSFVIYIMFSDDIASILESQILPRDINFMIVGVPYFTCGVKIVNVLRCFCDSFCLMFFWYKFVWNFRVVCVVKFHCSFFPLRGNTPGDLVNRSFFLLQGNTPGYCVSVVCNLLFLIVAIVSSFIQKFCWNLNKVPFVLCIL